VKKSMNVPTLRSTRRPSGDHAGSKAR
jgi:hypothetical protein